MGFLNIEFVMGTGLPQSLWKLGKIAGCIHKGKSSMKTVLKLGTAMVLALTLAGQTAAQTMVTELGEGEGQVNIVAWPGYLERGETDPKKFAQGLLTCLGVPKDQVRFGQGEVRVTTALVPFLAEMERVGEEADAQAAEAVGCLANMAANSVANQDAIGAAAGALPTLVALLGTPAGSRSWSRA